MKYKITQDRDGFYLLYIKECFLSPYEIIAGSLDLHYIQHRLQEYREKMALPEEQLIEKGKL